ncbi:negative regulator of sigma-X activity [Bacillus sp. T33-2]|uniref:negative regulator of sigma-X activity n=1 Tax=Bacillus sp. T33-2 TaxID=2054168 RepID=UPI000C762470|nr:negative regulator of sigma-X activity [Bacillus sp. T33-2]PLR99786.1 negative regulator of sigma-X activity [Bacillus sp. T33-2]
MRRSHLSDRQIEELLRQMPKIEDKRDPRDIYLNIARKVEKRKRAAWVFPGVATAAALLLIFILSSNYMSWNDSAYDRSGNKSSSSSEAKMDVAVKEEAEPENGQSQKSAEPEQATTLDASGKGNNEAALKTAEPNYEPTAVYQEDLVENDVITYHLPDTMGQVEVPVSVLVPKVENKSSFALFEETMTKIDEVKWGLGEYYPLNARISYDDAQKTVKVDVPADHKYGLGSPELTLPDTLNNTLEPLGVEKISFFTAGKQGIDLGHLGEITDVPVTRDKGRHAYFLFIVEGNERPYIVPTPEQFETVGNAFIKMNADQLNYSLTASIPPEIKLDESNVSVNGKTLTIRFPDRTQLTDDFTYSLEAILLTAKNFGFEAVKFENAGTEKIGPFNLNNEVDVPEAPNKKTIKE